MYIVHTENQSNTIQYYLAKMQNLLLKRFKNLRFFSEFQ